MKDNIKIILFAIGLITIGYFCGSIVDLNPLVSFGLFFVFTCMFVYSYANVFKLYNALNETEKNEDDEIEVDGEQIPPFYMDYVYEEPKNKEDENF